MRKRLAPLLALALLFAAAPAAAAVLPLAGATLRLEIASLPPVVFAWNGTGSADVAADHISNLSPGVMAFSGTIPVTDPNVFPILGLAITGAENGVGNFAFDGAGSGGGPMAIIGTANTCVFASCAAAPANVTVPFTSGGTNGIGLGGAPIVAPGLVELTISGNAWTTGTATIGSASRTGTATIGSVSRSGYAWNGTSVRLVTPAVIESNIGASPIIPVFGVLDIVFVPEPGTALLLALGVAGLSRSGRARMRS